MRTTNGAPHRVGLVILFQHAYSTRCDEREHADQGVEYFVDL